jgi:hypothetical protein
MHLIAALDAQDRHVGLRQAAALDLDLMPLTAPQGRHPLARGVADAGEGLRLRGITACTLSTGRAIEPPAEYLHELVGEHEIGCSIR